jgi:glycosyltransferase involved in cell wall biosynthesis
MKPRVLLVIDHSDSGGAQAVVGQIVRVLGRTISFSIAVLGRPGIYAHTYQAQGVPVKHLAGWAGKWDGTPLPRLVGMIRSSQIDIVQTFLFKSHILGTMAARWTGRVAIIHDQSAINPDSLREHLGHYFPSSFARRAYARAFGRAVAWCERILVQTPEEHAKVSRYYVVPTHKIVVLPNPVDVQALSQAGRDRREPVRLQLGLPPEARVVLMVGRLAPEKDCFTFLRVAEQLQQGGARPCQFLLAGSGPQEAQLKDYARSHEIHNVSFLGHRSDVVDLLHAADVFLLTSRFEPLGIVVLEAMAAGCPVIATQTAGPNAILTHGFDGLLAGVGDVTELAYAVRRVLEDENLRRTLVGNARETVRARHSLDLFGQRLAGLYECLL